MSASHLAEIFLQHEQDLFRFLLRRLKCALTAQDLTHELFVKITTQHGAADIRNRRAYLFRMAANLATDHQRAMQNRSTLLAEAHGLLWGDVEHRHPERTLIARQELARLEEALAQLPAMSRKIFYLNRFERKTQLDIAEELGVSISTVEAHIRKVLNHLAAVRDR
ncbi:RNA polymerase sigma factor [Nitrospira sp. BLG_2]|uniref:RNA polymerase sigma factor n=1 Tax=Nitrospira sp. BLG_2 TaxID=3397507 RepID=UPI003B9B7BBA